MSSKSPRWAWERAILASDLPSITRLVLFVLGIHANKEAEAWPSITTLAAGTGLSRRSVMEHIQAGTDAGWLLRLTQKGKGSRYLICIPTGAPRSPVTQTRTSAPRSPVPRLRRSATGDPGARTGDPGDMQLVNGAPKKDLSIIALSPVTEQGTEVEQIKNTPAGKKDAYQPAHSIASEDPFWADGADLDERAAER